MVAGLWQKTWAVLVGFLLVAEVVVWFLSWQAVFYLVSSWILSQ